jgi:hypothetical protein
MIPQFIRVSVREDSEVYISLYNISKIEVKYHIRGPDRLLHEVSLRKGLSDPEAIRVYTIYAGGDKFILQANPGSRTMLALEEIYKNAIKDD